MRVLIVDDEKNVRLTLTQALEDLGTTPEPVPGGRSALRRLAKGTYDLVLLDLKMPGLAGLETLRRIRSSHPDLPVVILTAHGSIERAVKATRLGAADFIQKPISLGELRQLIRRVLERSALRDREATSYDDLTELARWHVQKQQFGAARRHLKAATHTDPSRPEAHTLLGVLAAADGQIRVARRHYRRALEVDPEAMVPRMHLRQLDSGLHPLHLDRPSQSKVDSLSRPVRVEPLPPSNIPPSYRVLACVERDDEVANRALTRVAATSAQARETGDLTLLHVHVAPRQLSPSQAATAHKDAMQQMQRRLARLGRACTSPKHEVRTLVVAGHSIEQVIQNVVEKKNISHAVLGWSESATLRRVVRRVSCELTAVRPSKSSDMTTGGRQVAALISSSSHAPYVARRGLELAQRSGVASLTLLNVQARGSDTAETLQRRGQHVVWSAAERAGLKEDQYASRVLLADHVEDAIVDAVQRYDTICAGMTRSTALTEALFGSVVRRIITDTNREVAVVRGPKSTGRSFIEALGNRLSGR